MRVVAVRASHFSGRQRVGGNTVNLRPLRLVAGEAHLGLADLSQHPIILGMDLMAGRTGDIAALVLAAGPVGALAALVAAEAGIRLRLRCGVVLEAERNIDWRPG